MAISTSIANKPPPRTPDCHRNETCYLHKRGESTCQLSSWRIVCHTQEKWCVIAKVVRKEKDLFYMRKHKSTPPPPSFHAPHVTECARTPTHVCALRACALLAAHCARTRTGARARALGGWVTSSFLGKSPLRRWVDPALPCGTDVRCASSSSSSSSSLCLHRVECTVVECTGFYPL